ncbi:hypothetical protein [Roseovarius faecimaris]|nr:hypothetical protein [Roseovarius faecimaris]
MRRVLMMAALGLATAAGAWEEPARGTADRKALMDALRPHAEWMLGAPVEFVVYELRRAGDVAFASVDAQRPGGAQIDISQTPGGLRGELDEEYMDGSTLQALYRKVGQTWVAVHWEIGATDAWYSDPALCAEYRSVLLEICPD